MRRQDDAPRPACLRWLLDSDPAIRSQTMNDLAGVAPGAIAAERDRVASEGWGAHLPGFQTSAGNWGDSPRGWRADLPADDRVLMIALYALVVLKDTTGGSPKVRRNPVSMAGSWAGRVFQGSE